MSADKVRIKSSEISGYTCCSASALDTFPETSTECFQTASNFLLTQSDDSNRKVRFQVNPLIAIYMGSPIIPPSLPGKSLGWGSDFSSNYLIPCIIHQINIFGKFDEVNGGNAILSHLVMNLTFHIFFPLP